MPLPLVDILDDTGNYLHWKAPVGGNQLWVNPVQVKEVYKKHFENFQVFDIHEGDLIEHVLCRLLDNAELACAAYKKDKIKTK